MKFKTLSSSSSFGDKGRVLDCVTWVGSDMAAISLPVISKFDAVVLAPLTTLLPPKGPWLVRVGDCSDMGGLFQHLLNTFRRP